MLYRRKFLPRWSWYFFRSVSRRCFCLSLPFFFCVPRSERASSHTHTHARTQTGISMPPLVSTVAPLWVIFSLFMIRGPLCSSWSYAKHVAVIVYPQKFKTHTHTHVRWCVHAAEKQHAPLGPTAVRSLSARVEFLGTRGPGLYFYSIPSFIVRRAFDVFVVSHLFLTRNNLTSLVMDSIWVTFCRC